MEERDQLLTELGLLVDPIRRLIFSEEDPRRLNPYVRSQFHKDMSPFRGTVTRFCRPHPHHFETELDGILRATVRFSDLLLAIQNGENAEKLRPRFPKFVKQVQDAIRAVPCDDPGTILPAQSPYSTYLRLRAICRGAAQRLDLFDPYLTADTFHRYLRTIPDGVRVTIVTKDDIMVLPAGASAKDTARRDQIVSVSELLSIQFPDRYQFRVSSEPHDRHLRVDDTILHLGGSAKDAGKTNYFTISELDPIQSTHAFLDGIIAGATEWYGPSVTRHRRA